MEKELIANTCEDLYKECLREIPQYENGELIWILNGSTLCNILYNVIKIDGVSMSDDFRSTCYDFIRIPKGDIDISYRVDREYQFDLNNKFIKAFQNISDEVRTYNFVDCNSEITDDDLKELCVMETKNGLKFVAKRPEYLFLYKFKEFLALFQKEILSNDIDTIINKKPNIIFDVTNLYKIAITYCKDLNTIFKVLPMKSSYLNKLYNESQNEYYNLIKKSLEIIDSFINNNYNKSI